VLTIPSLTLRIRHFSVSAGPIPGDLRRTELPRIQRM